LKPFKPRVTVRTLALVVAFSAVLMALVVVPQRRQRYQQAERSIRQQVATLLRAAEEYRESERDGRETAARSLAFAEKEKREAAKWPEASEERKHHQHLATLWEKAARNSAGVADSSARTARMLKQRAEEIQKDWQRGADSLEDFERLAREAEKGPQTPKWRLLKSTLASVKRQVQEDEDKVGGANRPAILEAAAVWQAAELLKAAKKHPAPEKLKAKAQRKLKENDYMWKVTFSDPKTAQSYEVHTSFSEPTVKQYLAEHP
jgi:hypothetical protein